MKKTTQKIKKSNLMKKLLLSFGALILVSVVVSAYYLTRYGVGPLTYFTVLKPAISSINCVGGKGDCWATDTQIELKDKNGKTTRPVVTREKDIKGNYTGKSTTTITYLENGVEKTINTLASTNNAGSSTKTIVKDANGVVLVDRTTNDSKSMNSKVIKTIIDNRLESDGKVHTYNTTQDITNPTKIIDEITFKDGTKISTDGKFFDGYQPPTPIIPDTVSPANPALPPTTTETGECATPNSGLFGCPYNDPWADDALQGCPKSVAGYYCWKNASGVGEYYVIGIAATQKAALKKYGEAVNLLGDYTGDGSEASKRAYLNKLGIYDEKSIKELGAKLVKTPLAGEQGNAGAVAETPEQKLARLAKEEQQKYNKQCGGPGGITIKTCVKSDCEKGITGTTNKCVLIQGTTDQYGIVGSDFTGSISYNSGSGAGESTTISITYDSSDLCTLGSYLCTQSGSKWVRSGIVNNGIAYDGINHTGVVYTFGSNAVPKLETNKSYGYPEGTGTWGRKKKDGAVISQYNTSTGNFSTIHICTGGNAIYNSGDPYCPEDIEPTTPTDVAQKLSTRGTVVGGETVTNPDDCIYGGNHSNGPFYTCKYAPPGSLKPGESCVSGYDGSCEKSGDCRLITKPGDSSRGWYCMSRTTYENRSWAVFAPETTILNIIQGRLLKKGQYCFSNNSSCETNYCANNVLLSTCEDNPFTETNTTPEQSFLNLTPDPGAGAPAQVAQAGPVGLDTAPLTTGANAPANVSVGAIPTAAVPTVPVSGSKPLLAPAQDSLNANNFVYYSQRDPAWESSQDGITRMDLGEFGCGTAVTAMLYSNYSKDSLNPLQTRDKFFTHTNFMSGFYFSAAEAPLASEGFKLTDVSRTVGSSPMDEYSTATYAKPIVAGFKYKGAKDGHYVLVVGKDETGTPLVEDPYHYADSGKYPPIRLDTGNFPGLDLKNAEVIIVTPPGA